MKLKKEYWEIYRAAYQHTKLSENQKSKIIEIYMRDGRNAIYEAAKVKKLVPAISCLMCKLEVDLDFWKPIADDYRNRNLRVISCLDEMYSVLNRNGVKHIAVVENFGALLSSTQDLAMFGSGDLDEYALPEERDKIYSILKKNGYSIDEVKAGEIIVSSSIRRDDFPEGFYFGINWDVTNRVNLPSFSANGDFIGWDKCRYYKDTEIRLPSPEGLMYVCLMHIAVHGFCKAPDIRLYYDIANAAEQGLDWNVLANWAKRDGNSVKISMAAYLSHKLLGVEIPKFVFEIGNQKQFQRLLRVVYDQIDNRLHDFPPAKDRFFIDVYSNDEGVVNGIKEIVFPNNRWIKARYGSVLLGYIKHCIQLIR